VLVLLGIVIECPILLWIYFDSYADIETARTKMFLLLVFVELMIVMSFRSLRYSIFEAPPHKWLLIAMAWEIALLAVLLQLPSVREAFGIRMPSLAEVGMALAIGAAVLLTIELAKAMLRRRSTAYRQVRASTASPQRYEAAPVSPSLAGDNAMQRILVPVSSSPNCLFAVQHVVRQFMNNTATEVHLLNVQPAFRSDISLFVSKKDRDSFHLEEAEKALRPCREKLDRFGIPYCVHIEVGEKAACITGTAQRLRCDLILIGTARKNSLTRLVEDSVTSKVIELTSVPVEVVAGAAVANWERYGIPAAIAALIAMLLVAAD
jgi:nucleotide-binding universal stress UspA family protein